MSAGDLTARRDRADPFTPGRKVRDLTTWIWIPLGLVCAYSLGAIVTARVIYGLRRTQYLAKATMRRPPTEAVSAFERQERTQTALIALLAGVGWILSVPVLALRRGVAAAVCAHPPMTPCDRALRNRALHEHIAELERSLAIGQHTKTTDPVVAVRFVYPRTADAATVPARGIPLNRGRQW